MTKKDYDLIANSISRLVPGVVDRTTVPYHAGEMNALLNAAHSLAESLASQNPRFNRDRFMVACGF